MSRNKFPLFLAVIMAMALTTSTPDALSKTPSATSKYVVIPIYYLTDRNRKGNGFGTDRRYTVNCQHHMYYGTANIPVPNVEARIPDKSFEQLGWQSINKISSKISSKDMITASSPAQEKKLFLQRLLAALKQSGQNHLCLFLHGAADPFEAAAFNAAQLAYHMQCPVILHSWPSLGKLRRYRVDEGNIEWSQKHFDTFCQDLQQLAANQSFTVTLVAHSMGNRLLARVVPVLRTNGMVSDVALVSPDIDAETFKHYVMDYHNNGIKVRLYVSNKDKVLPFTQMLYGGYYRLGEGVGAVLSMISAPQQLFSSTSQSDNKLSDHSSSEPDIPGGIPEIEEIDFTAIDPGFIGHHFPYKLVSNMTRHDRPGDGLVLENSKEGSGNMFSRFSRWWFELGPVDKKNPSYCQRVVRQDQRALMK